MRTIKLLSSYLGNKEGDIIVVDNNIAFGLIDSGKATYDLKVLIATADEVKQTKEMRFGKKKKDGYRIK